jgi:rod shape-determining protein MreD
MNWFGFIALVYGMAILQSTVVPLVAIHGVGPNLLIILAVHYALFARPPHAVIACWAAGLVADLVAVDGVGPRALMYGLGGLLAVRVRPFVLRDHPLSQLFLTLMICWVSEFFVGTTLRFKGVGGPGSFLGVGYTSLLVAIYSAALAPYFHLLLRRLSFISGLQPSGSR